MADASLPAFDGKAFVHTLTTAPGVYRYFDVEDRLLYVGKAANLRKRVGSYFLEKLRVRSIIVASDDIDSVHGADSHAFSFAKLFDARIHDGR